MDSNQLLRMQTSPGREHDHATMKSPSMIAQSAPTEMIKISFDQIYRATPVNPILAQQLRRHQQQPIAMFPVSSPPLYPSSIGHTQYSSVYSTSPYIFPPNRHIGSIYQSTSNTPIIRPSSSPFDISQSGIGSPQQLSGKLQLTTASSPLNFSNPTPSPSSDLSKGTDTQAYGISSELVTMPPPPPVVGGSRSRRAASSSVDSLVVMKNTRDIPTAFVPASMSPHISAIAQFPSSVSTHSTKDIHSFESANAPSHSSPIHNLSPSKQSSFKSTNTRRRSVPSYAVKTQSINSPSAPKTVTRSGRISKPVHRISKYMDDPASRTSYSMVRSLNCDSNNDDSIQANPYINSVSTAVRDLQRNPSQPSETGAPIPVQVKKKVKRKRKDLTAKDASAKMSKSDANLSVGEKLRAMIAEADEALAGPDIISSFANSKPSANIPIKKKEKPWMPTEVVALYAVYNKTDVTLPNFWKIVSEKLQKDKNVHRSEEDCKEKWFAALVDMNKRQEKMIQKKKQSQVENALQKLQLINEQTAIRLGVKVVASAEQQPLSKDTNKKPSRFRKKRESEQVETEDNRVEEEENEEDSDGPDSEHDRVKSKRFRLSKNDLKVLAEQASKATYEDDVFESDSFRNRLHIQQLQKKESAVARYLQQQKSLFESTFSSPQHRFSSLESTPTTAQHPSLPSSSSPTAATTRTPSATSTSPGNRVNTLTVRRKSEMSSPGNYQQGASSILLDPSTVATPITTNVRPLRHMLLKSSLSSAGTSAVIGNRASPRDYEGHEEDDLFHSRVIQTLKRARHHPQMQDTKIAAKNTKKSKDSSSVAEISKQIHQEMRKVKGILNDEEEVEADEMD